MELLYTIALALGGGLALMAVLYVWAVRKRDMGIVDLGWTLGVGLCGVTYALMLGEGETLRRLLVALLAGVWSVRLAFHIYVHRVRGKQEDARYVRLREQWGSRATFFMPVFCLAQVTLAVLFSLPLLIAMTNPVPAFTPWDAAGTIVWIVAVLGEGAADRQLERFRGNPLNQGRTCRDGWWGYSRHPNYFFEWIHWFAYPLLAVGSPLAGWALAGPALMLVFLFGITGIPHTERQALARRGDDYRHYQQTTSAFIPWFKRRKVST